MAAVGEALRTAIAILQEASAADMVGEDDTALLLYVSSVARLEVLLPVLPKAHADVAQQHIDILRQRAEDLRSDKRRKRVTSEYPKFPVPFHYNPIPLEDNRHAIPHATILRPYWLMRTLSKSMQQGAFLTPDLYISKDVWFQDGATTAVTYVGPKVRLLASLNEALEPLQQISSLGDVAALVKLLDQFLRDAEQLKGVFDTEVGKSKGTDTIAQRSKIERGVWEFLHKGQTMLKSWKVQQDASYNAYIAWSVNVLEQTQLLDRWTQYFLQSDVGSSGQKGPNATDVLEKLHNVSALLYYSICSFLVQDAMLLVERYMDKSRESISRFMPTDVRVED